MAPGALAAVPGSLSYQAYLTNSDGSAVEGNTVITFSIYNVDLGGTPMWTDIPRAHHRLTSRFVY